MTAQTRSTPASRGKAVEWVTLFAILGCFVLWGIAVFWIAAFSGPIAVLILAVVLTFHSSLSHEALHGHPFRHRWLNEAVMWLPLGVAVPYARFRDLHLAHHLDANLTDPYDDPESNYLDPLVWRRLPGWTRVLLGINNTLAGRIVIGPAIGQAMFVAADIRRIRAGDRALAVTWGLHFVGVLGGLWVVALSALPVWAYLLSAYTALGILRIRTFAEHRAHAASRARTVIIEDRGPLAFLFLFNNLHVVHHMHPDAPWYQLPALYRQGQARYRAVNEGYVFASYGALFRAHLLRAKDPVPHPLWQSE